MTAILTDPHLRQCLADIVQQAKVGLIVETGTHDGTTTTWLANTFPTLDVYGIEINEHWARFARRALRSTLGAENRTGLQVIDGSSDVILRCNLMSWTGWVETLMETTLLILDAHFYEDWPLHGELQAINAARRMGRRFTVMIDDWFVENMPQFAGCYGGLRSDDSKGREHLLQPCAYGSFAAELDSFPHFYEPIYEDGGIGYCIASDFDLDLGDGFRRVR